MLAIKYKTYGPPDVLKVCESPDPEPGEDELLIRVHATAITRGDCELRSPEIFSTVWFIARLYFGLRTPRFQVPGTYFAGEVVQTGSGVTGFSPGDRVCGMTGPFFGAYAQLICVSEKGVITKISQDLSYAAAAPVTLGIDSLHFLRKLKVTSADHLLINGAGGSIGTYALQLAKMRGATVTAVDDGDKKSMLFDLGADAVIDYRHEPLTGKFDAILDVVGTIKHNKSLKLLRTNGRYVSAIPEFDRIILSSLSRIFTGKKIMTGITTPTVTDLKELVSLMESGKLRTWIDRNFAMDEIVEAHKKIEAGNKTGNFILLPQQAARV